MVVLPILSHFRDKTNALSLSWLTILAEVFVVAGTRFDHSFGLVRERSSPRLASASAAFGTSTVPELVHSYDLFLFLCLPIRYKKYRYELITFIITSWRLVDRWEWRFACNGVLFTQVTPWPEDFRTLCYPDWYYLIPMAQIDAGISDKCLSCWSFLLSGSSRPCFQPKPFLWEFPNADSV